MINQKHIFLKNIFLIKKYFAKKYLTLNEENNI